MVHVTSGSPSVAVRGTKAKDKAGPARVRIAKLQDVAQSSRAAESADFADRIYRELDPQGPLERLAAEHVAFSAWKLREALTKQVAIDRNGSQTRFRPAELDRASHSLREALEVFDHARKRARPEPTPVDEVQADFLSHERPIASERDALGPEIEGDVPEVEEIPIWRDRLIFDFEVSEISPVVKGTWITVGHVVSLIVDGWSWADILRSHPELSEDDIRTCVAYTMAEENSPAA